MGQSLLRREIEITTSDKLGKVRIAKRLKQLAVVMFKVITIFLHRTCVRFSLMNQVHISSILGAPNQIAISLDYELSLQEGAYASGDLFY